MRTHLDLNEHFDEELGRAARALVTEELPAGVLDSAVGSALGAAHGAGGVSDGVVRARWAGPGIATWAAASVVLLLVIAVALVPGGQFGSRPSPSPSQTASSGLRTTFDIRADLLIIGYSCTAGRPLSTIEPGPDAVTRETVVCMAPAEIGPFIAAVIVGESAGARVVSVHAKADFVGADTPAGRAAVASALAKAAAISVAQGSGTSVGNWVSANIPALEPNDGVSTEMGGLSLRVGRTSDGGYVLFVELGSAG